MDVGLYVHVPFCLRKCPYCDFYSTVPREGDVEPVVDALLTEMASAIGGGDTEVETIFVGGGTPTCLPVMELRRLFTGLGRVAAEHAPVEFTVEANPATLTDEKAAVLRASGVTRISLGAQSFHDAELAVLGRLHDPADIAGGADAVRRAGFEHLNLDLMFGVPGQTLPTWRESLRRTMDLGPDHIACYGLTYEPGTPLRARRDAGEISPVDEDLEAELYETAIDELAAGGFRQYEISNFARPGDGVSRGGQCLHNLRYWRNRPGVGIGPSAASYIGGRRWRNVPDTAKYVEAIRAGRDVAVESERLTPLARAGETAMLRLRLVEGIRCAEFRAETGFDPHRLFGEAILRHARRGLLSADAERIALTREGRLVADAVIVDFLGPGHADHSRCHGEDAHPAAGGF